ncbi:putative excisionase [Sphingobium herbicidovorans NBRC 16415]|uniref:Excisionase n=2 Tax=Sphingobium herbicidovorans TaxID=76947 RepID=A0A086PBT2_SPHHM|nr:helix-turn-helix domain-containing protein [Sphingobium herbicidovorans]KFG90850.1 putative excisionase [Sphingobium herbicidovorans NBRC 16415]
MNFSGKGLPFGNRLPSADDRQIANQLRRILASQKAGEAKLRVPDPNTKKPVEITLTPTMSDLFLELLRHIGSGHAVTLVPIQQMLTTQQAADLLDMSRPYLIKLIEKGYIPHNMVGRHRRLKSEDVFAYKAARDKIRSKAIDELIADGADLD